MNILIQNKASILLYIIITSIVIFAFGFNQQVFASNETQKELSSSIEKTKKSLKESVVTHSSERPAGLNSRNFIDQKAEKSAQKIIERYGSHVDPVFVKDLVRTIYRETPKYANVDAKVILALIDTESTWKKQTKASYDGSSYGSMQVNYRVWKKTCGLKSPSELYNTNTAVHCGLTVFGIYYDKSNGNIRRTLQYYRGSKYSSTNIKYASKVLSKVKYF